MSSHEQTVRSQFDPRAHAYLTSAVHASGPDLERAKTLVARLFVAEAGRADRARARRMGIRKPARLHPGALGPAYR